MIQNLPSPSSLASSDYLAVFSGSLGQDAKATLTQLLTWLQGQLTASTTLIPQFASPNVSGFAVNVSPTVAGGSVWLLSTPLAAYANLTINLPVGYDGQEVLVTSTQAVTGALTVTGALVGAANQPVNGAPATLAANGFFRLKFNAVNGSWYRIT